MDELVGKLSSRRQRVVLDRAKSAAELRESIDRGFVLIRFTETKGETVLGLQLDKTRSKTDAANFSEATGVVHLAGTLVLNYNEVEVTADIDLATLEGEGGMKLLTDEATWRAKQSAKQEAEAGAVH
jgi:hypothetical protein